MARKEAVNSVTKQAIEQDPERYGSSAVSSYIPAQTGHYAGQKIRQQNCGQNNYNDPYDKTDTAFLLIFASHSLYLNKRTAANMRQFR